jgi:hypothetical protein
MDRRNARFRTGVEASHGQPVWDKRPSMGEIPQLVRAEPQNLDQVDHPQVVQTGGRQVSGKAKTALPEFLAGPR